MLPFSIKLVSTTIFEPLKYYKKGVGTGAGVRDSDGAVLNDKFKHHII